MNDCVSTELWNVDRGKCLAWKKQDVEQKNDFGLQAEMPSRNTGM